MEYGNYINSKILIYIELYLNVYSSKTIKVRNIFNEKKKTVKQEMNKTSLYYLMFCTIRIFPSAVLFAQ